ncbi:3656_t:CDS:2 [Funneliformis geosporum]|uniref:11022_t:CDS:1 n=1 Tax=Funneliformis geosporum TaxID=1117311 RepID=A0A9W4T2L8_9GLOM|nr:11022_t:CDS:2 [Funneliformis geosporum]CAI2189816.1 3656_t:CDS:2 [Funneliformis geosporum]
MVNAQEYIENNFPKDVIEVNAANKDLEGHLDLSKYPNLTKVNIGINNQLTGLKLAHSNQIVWMSIYGTRIDDFSFLACMLNIQTVYLSQSGEKIGDGPGNAYIAKAIRESCQENYKFQNSLRQSNQTQLDQERKKNSDNSQRIKELEQHQIKELYNITFSNSTYNFTNLKNDIIRLKFQELAPQVRNENANLVQLIFEAKNKAGNLSSIVNLILETQKQIIQNSVKQEKLSSQIEACQTILASSLAKEELQILLNKQIEVLELEKHLESIQRLINEH